MFVSHFFLSILLSIDVSIGRQLVSIKCNTDLLLYIYIDFLLSSNNNIVNFCCLKYILFLKYKNANMLPSLQFGVI